MVYQIFSGSVYHIRILSDKNSFRYSYDMVMIGCNGIKYPEEFKLMLKELNKTNFDIKEEIDQCKIFWLSEPGLFGMRFNPISFWYIVKDNIIKCILVTVTNTPWGESILYEIPNDSTKKVWKKMHVSPFNPPSDQYYLFKTNMNVGDFFCLDNKIQWNLKLYNSDNTLVIMADMNLDSNNTHQYITKNFIITIIRIYWQAFLLWIKKTPLYNHEKKQNY